MSLLASVLADVKRLIPAQRLFQNRLSILAFVTDVCGCAGGFTSLTASRNQEPLDAHIWGEIRHR
jgi:hypothetical protein